MILKALLKRPRVACASGAMFQAGRMLQNPDRDDGAQSLCIFDRVNVPFIGRLETGLKGASINPIFLRRLAT
jgi:hypothetical protein